MKKTNKKLYIILTILIIIICIILFKVLPFGYNVHHLRFKNEKVINLGVPKFSFMMKNKNENYSYKNLRGEAILKKEMQTYLKTLKPVSCNNTTYYYDEGTNTTIVDYSVSGNLIYNTISYSFKNGNYCNLFKADDFIEKLGPSGLKRLNNENISITLSFNLNKDDLENLFTAYMYAYKVSNRKTIEYSKGTVKLENNKLIYTRSKINTQIDGIDIPKKSIFTIQNKNLNLQNNYLSDYTDNVILR